MSSNHITHEEQNKSNRTKIRVKGHLDDRWRDWFDGLTITLTENGETLLSGHVPDQAALYGLLRKVRDMGLPLLTVEHAEGPSLEEVTTEAEPFVNTDVYTDGNTVCTTEGKNDEN